MKRIIVVVLTMTFASIMNRGRKKYERKDWTACAFPLPAARNRALFLINSANVVIPMPSNFRAVRKCGRLCGESHGYCESDTSQQRLHGPLPNFSFSRRRGLPLTPSNAAQRGTHIHPRNRKRFDGAVAVVRSVAVAIRVLA